MKIISCHDLQDIFIESKPSVARCIRQLRLDFGASDCVIKVGMKMKNSWGGVLIYLLDIYLSFPSGIQGSLPGRSFFTLSSEQPCERI